MTFQRTPNGDNLANKALTKAIIYFKDTNIRTFHSRDCLRQSREPKKDIGIARLRKMIESMSKSIATAIIYDKESGEEIMKFKGGHWV